MHDSPEHGGSPADDDIAGLPPALTEEIRRYYEQGAEQDRLLKTPQGRLEFLRTKELLARYLPKPPAIILDVGGGPGVYSCWLASSGYVVHLIDPVPLHIQQAHAASQLITNRIASCTVGDARHLHHESETADVVLLLGPLYHLLQKEQRLWALQEAYRVLRPGGLIATMVISRFAAALEGMITHHLEDSAYQRIVKRGLLDGEHRTDGQPEYFTTAYLHHPAEIRRELANASFLHQGTFAVEGPAWLLGDLSYDLDAPDRAQLLMDQLSAFEADSSLLGTSKHILTIGGKPI